jgi:hypothetical protein
MVPRASRRVIKHFDALGWGVTTANHEQRVVLVILAGGCTS